ncbi:MAG: tetratricopeptide repeat protein [Armatimonadetes bacterium]|nr:tetratricopeptide repeat protein [Armatimonadota bacterium]
MATESEAQNAELTIASMLSGSEPPDIEVVWQTMQLLAETDLARLREFAEAVRQKGLAPGLDDMALSFTAYHSGDYETAASAIDAVLVRYPSMAPALALLAVVRVKQRRFAQAADAAQRALDAGAPETPELLAVLGVSLIGSGRSRKAITILKKAREANTSSPEMSRTLRLAYLVKWQAVVKFFGLVCAAWAVADASVLGSVMAVIAVGVFALLAVLAALSRRLGTLLLWVALAVGAAVGHILLAPSAFG